MAKYIIYNVEYSNTALNKEERYAKSKRLVFTREEFKGKSTCCNVNNNINTCKCNVAGDVHRFKGVPEQM